MKKTKNKLDRSKAEKGPFFQVGYHEALARWLHIGTKRNQYGKPVTPKNHRLLITSLLEQQKSKGQQVISVEQLLPIAAAQRPNMDEKTLLITIRGAIKAFHDLGILNRKKKQPKPGQRVQYVYTVNSPEDVALQHEQAFSQEELQEFEKISTKIVRQREVKEKLMGRGDIMAPLDFNANEPWSLLLLTQLMERCCRRSLSDSRESIEATVNLGSEQVKVVAFTVTRDDKAIGGRPGLIADYDSQVMLALITMAMQHIERATATGKQPVNRMVIDVVALCKLLDKPDAGTNRKTVVQSLRRIIYTTWTIMPDTRTEQAKRIEQELGFKISEMDFQLIRDAIVGVESDNDQANRSLDTPRWFTVTLNDFVWRSLIRGVDTRLLHQDILRESNPLIQKLHAHIRLHTPKEGKIVRTMGVLSERFGSTQRVNAFSDKVKKTLLKKAGVDPESEIPEEGVKLDFFGYNLIVKNDPLSQSGRVMIEAERNSEGEQTMSLEQEKVAAIQKNMQLDWIMDQKVIDH